MYETMMINIIVILPNNYHMFLLHLMYIAYAIVLLLKEYMVMRLVVIIFHSWYYSSYKL